MNPRNVFSILTIRKRATGTTVTQKARERFFGLLNEAVDELITTKEWNQETKEGMRQILQSLKIQIETMQRKSSNPKKRKIWEQQIIQLANALLVLKTQRETRKIIIELNRTRDQLEELRKEEQALEP